MSTTDKLTELREQHAASLGRESALKSEASAALADVRRLEEELVEAFKAGELYGDGGATVVEKALLTARRKAAEPWRERVEAAHRAAEQRRGEVESYVNANLRELADELVPGAEAAAERLEAALQILLAARGEWEGVASSYGGLLAHVQGLDGSDLPQSGADELASLADKLLASGVRPPLPRTLYAPAGSPLAERAELLTGERAPVDAA